MKKLLPAICVVVVPLCCAWLCAGAQDDTSRDAVHTTAPAQVPTSDGTFLGGATSGLYGSVGLSTGYDTAVYSVQGASGQLLLMDSTLGFVSRHPRSTFLLEHDGTVTRSFGTGLETVQFQRVAATLRHQASHTTDWSLTLDNGYGEDAARATGSLTQSTLTNSLPTQDAPVYGATTGNTLNDHAAFQLTHELSETRAAHVTAEAYVRHFFDEGTTSQQYSLSAGLTKIVSPRYSAGIDVEAVEQRYTQISCTTGSITLSGSVRVSQGLNLQGLAGPAAGTRGCSGGYSYEGLVSERGARNSLFYVGSSRKNSDGYITNSSRETLVYGGTLFGSLARLETRVDAGYANYALLRTAVTSEGSVRGSFVSAVFSRRLTETAKLSLTTRYFTSGGSQVHPNRTLVLLTYTWSHQPHGMANMETGGSGYGR